MGTGWETETERAWSRRRRLARAHHLQEGWGGGQEEGGGKGGEGRMRGLQGSVGDWSSGMTAWVSRMTGRWGVGWGICDEGSEGGEGEGRGVWEISGNTHMLESGHAQLHFHKISKILVCWLSGCPSSICLSWLLRVQLWFWVSW